MTNVAKSAQNPHSKLKTQKELKKITDSSSYKKADYKGKTEMLGGKTWTAQEMQTKIKNKRPKSYSWNKTRILKAKGGRAGFQHGGRTNLLEELGRVEGEHSNRNRRAEVSRIHGELNKGYKSGGRAKHGLGSIVKKIVTKIKPKPKGKGLGSGIKPSEVKDILKSPGKSWGKTRAEYLREYAPYFGGRSIKKQVKEGVHARNKASKKVFKSAKGKAAGGRIGLSHGGSAGAAIRGRGAEIK